MVGGAADVVDGDVVDVVDGTVVAPVAAGAGGSVAAAVVAFVVSTCVDATGVVTSLEAGRPVSPSEDEHEQASNPAATNQRPVDCVIRTASRTDGPSPRYIASHAAHQGRRHRVDSDQLPDQFVT